MDQIITVGITLISLLLGGAVSLFVQRQGRQEKLKISEAVASSQAPPTRDWTSGRQGYA
jgi:hypothetical protein